DAASDRIQFEEIGKTTLDRPFVYATISSAENLKNLEKYKEINAKLADPRLIKSNQKLADELIKQGKTIVLITCGVHSTEVGSTLSSMLIAEKLVKAEDAETKKILENTIVLLVPSLNPDGVDIVKNWYDKTLGTPYEGTSPPELYHKYVGHDNNRDWYAFTQVETQLTVDKIHNVWHPQIVHDIHQQGDRGARLFLPPYMQPVEPNVPKELVEGYTELGNFIAEDLRGKGFQGITTDSTYDAWTPARAYSHYHGGVRILSETASAKLASPTNIKFETLRGDLGYDAKKETPNFRPVWKGGDWRIGDITNYMTTAAFSLMKHASDNRQKWLTRFYTIGKEAVRPRNKSGELYGFRIKVDDNLPILLDILERSGVQYGFPKGEKETKVKNLSYFDSVTTYPSESIIIPLEQPYGDFAKAVLEKQVYPNLLDDKGSPIQPYDVTAHTLSLLMNVKVEEIKAPFKPNWVKNRRINITLSDCMFGLNDKKAIYKSYIPSMDEGWTRWTLEKRGICEEFETLTDSEIKTNNFNQKKPGGNSFAKQGKEPKYKTIIFPDQSPNQMLNGYAKGTMPDEYTGGIGKDGVANLRKFVEAGGTLVFLNRASDFAIREFNLPVKDVTEGLPRKDFYIPGSILRIELDTNHPIAKNMPKESIAWFEDSPAFEIKTDPLALTNNFKIIATYPKDPKNILLSGWALGAEKLAGKAALVEFTIGKGKIILFGFRPQYRGQSLATFPLLFNAIAN
ncbi:MAG TPA: M14 family zinc carboxypeptidase, partial [Pyrinomonadaceae bacterium]|nr:M14 family zinc carboxypeptidase [Pyrinomonadaceae bacterium]